MLNFNNNKEVIILLVLLSFFGCSDLPTNGISINELTKDELDYESIIPKEILESNFGDDEFHGIDSFNEWKREKLRLIWNYSVNKDSLDSIPTHTYFHNGNPYNGIAYERDLPIATNSVLFSIWIYFRSGGELSRTLLNYEQWREYTFKDGKKDGPWVLKSQGDDLSKIVGYYKDGLKDGVEKQWNSEGVLIREQKFKDGKRISQ